MSFGLLESHGVDYASAATQTISLSNTPVGGEYVVVHVFANNAFGQTVPASNAPTVSGRAFTNIGAIAGPTGSNSNINVYDMTLQVGDTAISVITTAPGTAPHTAVIAFVFNGAYYRQGLRATVSTAGTTSTTAPATASVADQVGDLLTYSTIQAVNSTHIGVPGTPTLPGTTVSVVSGNSFTYVAGYEIASTNPTSVSATPSASANTTLIACDHFTPLTTTVVLAPEFPGVTRLAVAPQSYVDVGYGGNTATKTISGIIYNTAGATVSGATVVLFRQVGNSAIATTTTDGSGHYSFTRDAADANAYYVLAYSVVGGTTQIHGASDRGNVPA